MESTLSEYKSILKVIELYKDGHHHSDLKKLKQAFHPNARIAGYYENELVFEDRDQYLEMLAQEKSSAELGEPSDIKILSLDKTDTTVIVKIKSQMAGSEFISYLSMLKIDDTWQIINGLFHICCAFRRCK